MKNTFHYNIYMAAVNLDQMKDLEKSPLFNLNKRGLLAFFDSDHFKFEEESSLSTREKINAFFSKKGLERPETVLLLTHLRVMGYVFNPVSFYFCYDRTGKLSHILMEVNNTYHEQKAYLIDADSEKRTHSERKHFYVSPFIGQNTNFRITWSDPEESTSEKRKLFIRIDSSEDQESEPLLKTHLTGTSVSWTNQNIIKLLLNFPFVTLKVILLIHYQALKLYLKKVPYFSKADTNKEIQKDLVRSKN